MKQRLFILFSALAVVLCSVILSDSLTTSNAAHANSLQRPSIHYDPPTSCSGEGCDGNSPYLTACNLDAGTPLATATVNDSTTNTQITVNLYYSNKCGTNWAEIPNGHDGILLVSVIRTTDGKLVGSESADSDNVNSGMIYAPSSPVKACVFRNIGPDSTHPQYNDSSLLGCTDAK